MSFEHDYDDGEVNAFIGPMPSGAWHRAHAAKLIEEARRNDAADTQDFMARLALRAAEETERWEAVPCHGELALVGNCSDTFAITCAEYDHGMCARRQASRRTALAERLRADRRSELESAGVSARTLRAVFDSVPVETDAVVALREAFASAAKPTIVVLQGGVGCGKSCAAALWAIDSGARWLTSKSLARMGYEDEIAVLGRAKALVLDDLGTEYADAKGFFVSNLDGLIDDRYSRELLTVITTNVGPADFKARYGERIADRIRECGKFIGVKGDSLRGRK